MTGNCSTVITVHHRLLVIKDLWSIATCALNDASSLRMRRSSLEVTSKCRSLQAISVLIEDT